MKKLCLLLLYFCSVHFQYGQDLRSIQQRAVSGEVQAIYELGTVLYQGLGIPKDRTTAFKWLWSAAQQGHPDAQYTIGFCYTRGSVVDQSFEEGAKWVRKAAEKGHAYAANALAAMYTQGLGVPKSGMESAKWYQSAATGGHTEAQLKLAEMYETGDVIQQDFVRAHAWYQVAALLGVGEAFSKRDKVARSMDASGHAKAQAFTLQILQQLGSKPAPIPAIHTGGTMLKSTDVRNMALTLPPILPASNPLAQVAASPPTTVPSGSVPATTPASTSLPSITPTDPITPTPALSIQTPYIREGQPFVIPELDMEMVWVERGKFTMGNPERDGKTSRPGEARHEVRISKGFWLGMFEVTNAQYSKLTGNEVAGENKWPVVNLSWNQAHDYCEMLQASFGKLNRLPRGYAFQLPSEAQWEFACKAGTKTEFHFGDDITPDFANIAGSGRKRKRGNSSLVDVGSYKPNPWGFYDMHGNAMEFVYDWWGHYPTDSPNITDPLGATDGTEKLTRGGSWRSKTTSCRSSSRSRVYDLDSPMKAAGLRVCLAPIRK